ncbi:VanZ family protein [Metabacillus litoralis]|uniref:VanZ family protein n=1 Tax=Metabacillus litoralis TaxID=152268 RepID=UPI0020405AB8|nr:VanZ family protein [Metabacillus litoralis]MCM3652945.1 VanZ family protein [Metabacillus litoralis]
MRTFIVTCYIGMIFIFTCTESLFLLLQEQKLSFQFNTSPSFSDFFINDLINNPDITYFNQKAGHIICFFILALLLYWTSHRVWLTTLLLLIVAFSTEFAQLFFSRSGRLLDVFYDSIGLTMFLVFYLFYQVIVVLDRSDSYRVD